MALQPFDQNRTNPDDQAVFKNKPIAAGTTGPYAPAKTDPASYRNQFVSQLRRNPPANKFYDQVFSAQSAQTAQQEIQKLTNQPNFTTPGDQKLAQDFLNKYTVGAQRGLIPQDQMISQNTIAAFQSQQPGQGIGDGNVTAASKMRFSGDRGTLTS
jgi:lipopolysaccharide export system protein LptC